MVHRDETIDEEILRKSVEIAKNAGAREIIAKIVQKSDYQIRFSKSAIDVSVQWDSYSLELFLSIGRRVNVLTIQNPDLSKIMNIVPNVVKALQNTKKTLLYWGMQKTKSSAPAIPGLFYTSMGNFSSKAPDLINGAIQSSLENGAQSVAGVLYYGLCKTGVLTGYGNGGFYDNSYYQMTLRAFADAESSGQDNVVGRDLSNIDKKFQTAGTNAAKIARMAIGGQQGHAGKYDLIMSPTVAANVLGELVTGANPVYMITGMTCLGKSLNKQIGPESLSVSDNAIIPEGLNSRPFDYEGTPSQITPLITNGKYNGMIQTATTAKLWSLLHFYRFRKEKSTGNAYLGSFFPDMDYGPKLLSPMFSNLVFKPGDMKFEEMVQESKRPTIYLTSNWYTRYTSQLQGIFSTIPRDGMFLIENGEIKKPLRKMRLSETLLGMCNRIQQIGNDVKQIRWWEVNFPTFIPHIKVRDCNFTAATQ